MRVLMISDHADPLAQIGAKEAGGQNVYVNSLARHLAAAGVFVDVATRWDDPSKAEVVRVSPRLRVIRVKAGPLGYMPRDNFIDVTDEFAANLAARIKREEVIYDYLHTNYWFSGVIGLRIRRQFGIPMYHVYHSIGEVRRRTLLEIAGTRIDEDFFARRLLAEKSIASEATGIIATSPGEKSDVIRLLDGVPHKITVIPVGVDETIFKPRSNFGTRARLGLPLNADIVLYAGRLERRKGIATLIESFAAVKRSRPKAKLLIVGGGTTHQARQLDRDEINYLTALADEHEVVGDITFVGGRDQDEMAYYYAAADVVATPSYYEPFGIVPLEAMACGTPVVATKTGGFLYTIKHGETGYLAEVRDADSLADYIVRVLELGRSSYTAACLRQIRTGFLWSSVTRQTIEHIQENSYHEDRTGSAVRRIGSA